METLTPSGLDISTIDPKLHPKFSPNLHAYLMKQSRPITRQYSHVFKDGEGTQWLGFMDDTNCFVGARLMRVLSEGKKAETFSYVNLGPLTEVEGFWTRYREVGRCAIDPEHEQYFVGYETRYEGNGAHRHCVWCDTPTPEPIRPPTTMELLVKVCTALGLERAKDGALPVDALLARLGQLDDGSAAVPWDKFPGYLIDNHEGDEITEECLHAALASMLKNERYVPAPDESDPWVQIQPGCKLPDRLDRVLVATRDGLVKESFGASVMELIKAAARDKEDCYLTDWRPMPEGPNRMLRTVHAAETGEI